MKNIISLNLPKKSQAMEDLEWLTEFLLANGRDEMAKELNDDFAAFQQTLKTEKTIEAA
ncbi:hypothetical protein KA183_16380 [bacterium]|nr:hypothetical protein [bacterium]QQR59414.1 MAG: hypothetical protein IPG59_07970 [Candidatus Melainabacteria bacterium]